MPGAAIGTPAYMSPEQADGAIDEIDDKLVTLIHERMHLARAAACAKRVSGRPMRDTRREAQVVRRAAGQARDCDVMRARYASGPTSCNTTFDQRLLAERLAAQEYAAAARHLMKELAKGGVRAEIARREWAEYEEMQRNDS